MPEPVALSHVDIVLVRPRQSGNVGAAARAIANHGLGRLILVDPPALDPEEARWMAPNATEVVDRALLFSSVSEAVAGHERVVGTSGRPRRWRWPVLPPWELAEKVVLEPRPTAILFGPEDFGLGNDDLLPCTEILTLPTAGHASLNLGQAVTVTCSWLLGAACQQRDAVAPVPTPRRAAPTGLLQDLEADALSLLEASGYLKSRSSQQVQATLHGLLSRLDLSWEEAGMLRGMLKPLRFSLGLLPRREE